jgi:valyl-tRNA synthetase
VGEVEIFLIDAIDEEKEKLRRQKKVDDLEKQITFLKKQLDNKEFVDKAPKKVVQVQEDKLSQFEIELKKLKNI